MRHHLGGAWAGIKVLSSFDQLKTGKMMKPLNFELVQFAQKFGIPFEWDPFGLQSLQ